MYNYLRLLIKSNPTRILGMGVHCSRFIGLILEQCGIGRDLGVIIVAIKQSTGNTKFNPTSRRTLEAGDTLIALGETSKLRTIEEMANTGRS
jgi:K+/H+ antiporter YhaU regulatory subunit KhtT